MAVASKFPTEPDIITTLDDTPRNECSKYNDVDHLGASGVDVRDMTRMGKVQELKVNTYVVLLWGKELVPDHEQRAFRPLAALSFSAVLQATWEFILMWVFRSGSMYNGN